MAQFAKIATGTSSATSGFKSLTGYTIAETAAAAAVVTIRDASGGNILWRINLAANESMGDNWGGVAISPTGFGAENFAFFFSVDSGTVRWTAFGA